MTLARSKTNFLEDLADEENKVIALSGKWGTGKSHLWKEVQGASADDMVKGAIYVSLFGAGSVGDLKLKIAQQVIPKLEAGGVLAESVKTGWNGVKKFLKGIHSGFSALDELALIAAPLMIRGRFIVIDDIERKHANLSIDEILGFIDDCVQNLGCRVLVILNSDQLGDKKIWELFREKVIDQEIRLDTSPAEAFDIAVGLTSTPYAVPIKAAVEACKVTNIRIVRKIIRVVNRLLAGRGELAPEVLARVIPSITLLSAINYKGIEDGPDFEFVLGFENSYLAAMLREDEKKKDAQETPEAKARERWRLLMDKLGILGTDEFEALVVDYLKSGLVESAALARIIDRYAAEHRQLAARSRTQEFFERSIWRVDLTDAQLLDELRAMLPEIGLVDMFTVTSLHRQASKLGGGEDVARELVARWIAAFRDNNPPGQDERIDPDFNFFRRPLHPEIEAEIRALMARHQSSATLLEVCRRIAEDRSWGNRENSLMRSITPAEYEAQIVAATGQDLKLILLESMDFLKNRGMFENSFGGGIESFVQACRAIVAREPESRLGRLVGDLFKDAGMQDKLAPPAQQPEVEAAVAAAPAAS